MDIDGSAYSSLIGFRGWSDSSGGNAHELAFTGNGNLYHRQGSTTAWSSWNRIPMCGTDNTFSGINTFSGQVVLSRTTDADGTTDAKPALRIGAISGTHLELDGNEIMAKSDATHTGPLYLNNNGGLVSIGSGGLSVSGTATFDSTSTFKNNLLLNSSSVHVQRAGISQSWYQGRNSAIIKTTSYSGYDAILSMKTTAGDWALGVYNDNKLYFTYILDSNYNANTNTTTAQIRFDPDGNVAAPKFTGALVGNASTATKLATARTLKVNLARTSASSGFDGSANITNIGVAGTLPVGNGGTGRAAFSTTDYTGNQYRASKIQDTIPTSVDNGCLVYVYVPTSTI